MATTPRSLAQEVVSYYLYHIDESLPHVENVRTHLRAAVLRVQQPPKTLEEESVSDNKDVLSPITFSEVDEEAAYEALDRSNKARLDAFLQTVELAVPPGPRSSSSTIATTGSSESSSLKSKHSDSLDGLAGFQPPKTVLASWNDKLFRQTSHSTKRKQIRESDLVTLVELHLQSSLHEPCLWKTRALCVVTAFVHTVGTVRQQSPVLTRLLTCHTMALLGVSCLGTRVVQAIQRVVSDYEHQTSFASLAFLSSPDDSAHTVLWPMVLRYFKSLDWQACVDDCALEEFLRSALDGDLRRTFHTMEFASIGHLLEICHKLRHRLDAIALPPKEHPQADVRQALRDLQRERLTVNGHVLPPVTSRSELVRLLSQTLHSQSPVRRRRRPIERDDSFSDLSSSSETSSKSSRRFSVQTMDALTKRLLLAAARTDTGGDAFFVVRDLFGGEDVAVVPARSGTMELVVQLTQVVIRCHGSFDVYPSSRVGEVEPLIQLHTTTTEVIALREVRACDVEGGEESGSRPQETAAAAALSDDDDDEAPPTVLQERLTDRTGWRTLSIRPALYEKVEVWNTPS